MATAQLDVDSSKFNLPVVKASAGPDGIVVSKLRNDGWVTLAPGFLTTAQCESKITYIDGKHSILRYRGYPIEQLCENSDFLEVAWLLRHGELPSKAEYEQFCADINHKTMVGEDFRTFMGSFPRAAHPMSVLAAAVNALAAFYPDTTDITDSDQLDEAAKIDGCSYWGIFVNIILPLMKPALVTGGIFSFMRRWDDFLSALLYVNKSSRYPVSLALKLFCDPGSSSDYGAMFAMATLSILPAVCIFIFFQKYLVEGISTSGLKG